MALVGAGSVGGESNRRRPKDDHPPGGQNLQPSHDDWPSALPSVALLAEGGCEVLTMFKGQQISQ